MVDYSNLPGVEADMGDGDEWPKIRQTILDSDILVVSTPVWVGHPSSIAQRVLERLDAELSNTDDGGRPVTVGKVAIVAVVGNEDGAHKIIADMFQALNDMASPSQLKAAGTGTARPCRPRTTRISTKSLSRSPRPPPRPLAMRRFSPECCAASSIRPISDVTFRDGFSYNGVG
jgi:multimeric flavodoxin WrbA